MHWKKYLRRAWWDRERAREIEAYLDMETAENIARGMTPADAAAAARRKFGNPTLVREEIYRMNTIGWMESLWQDLRYGLRLLRLSPSFATVAILSLALGIGANTAIFQLLDAVRLRSLPVREPGELAEVRIRGGNQGMGLNQQYGQLTRPLWREIKTQQKAFSGVFSWTVNGDMVGEGTEMRPVGGLWVSGDFFRVLGVQSWRGRLLTPEDEGACPGANVVVSYAYWQREMGGRGIGADTKLKVDGQLTTVVGVTPPEFLGMIVGDHFDIAIPFCQPNEPLRRDVFDVAVMGRLRPGWTMERASAHLDAISPGLFEATAIAGYSPEETARYKRLRLAAYPAGNGVSALRTTYDSSLWLLLGITGLVLLIACVNLANLILARSSARAREVAVRLALGASRGRLLRQMLAESALLAAIGAVLGIGLAQALSRVLVWSLSTQTNKVNLPIDTDWRVLLFAAAVAALTCVVFGALPAMRATRAEPVSAMKAGGRGLTAGRERFTLRRFMVAVQIAVCLVLLVGALLFVRSFRNLITLDPGMREGGITVAFVGYPFSRVPPERNEQFKRELLDDVRSTPGIADAATTTMVPLIGGSWGHHVHVGPVEGGSQFTWVSPGYFHTMNISLLTGRGFSQNDTSTSQRVAVVNQAFVRRFLGSASPLGRTLRTVEEPNYPATEYQIVGVIPDTRYDSVRSKMLPMTFAPAAQFPAQGPWTAMMIWSSEGSPAVAAAVRHRIAAHHPEVILQFTDFQGNIRDGMVRERLMAMLSGFFGVLAAVLTMVGLYGVISYVVARRRNEIGIRLALGAGRGQVVGMVMKEAIWLLAIGVAAGTGLSLVVTRGATSLLFGLKPHDPLTLGAAAALLAGVAALASFLPARRASKLDPMEALRYE
jgi:predicted permease